MNSDQKLLLILDLDETLVHATRNPLPGLDRVELLGYHVHSRPGLLPFLQQVSEHFTIAVWSSASPDYVSAIVATIFPPHIPLAFVWARNRCTPRTPVYWESRGVHLGFFDYEWTKPLIKVKRKGYDLRRVLIIDDTPAKVRNAYGNAIYPTEWTGDPNDDELPKLAQYLLRFKDLENVRLIEKRGWQTRV